MAVPLEDPSEAAEPTEEVPEEPEAVRSFRRQCSRMAGKLGLVPFSDSVTVTAAGFCVEIIGR